MKTLTSKTTKEALANRVNEILGRIIVTGGVHVTAKTIKFYANEKNGQLAPLTTEVLIWAKEKGFEMTARPVGKQKINNEYFEGKTQDVIWQRTCYILK